MNKNNKEKLKESIKRIQPLVFTKKGKLFLKKSPTYSDLLFRIDLHYIMEGLSGKIIKMNNKGKFVWTK